MNWQRINQNSHAQFMRTRERLVFVARPLVRVPGPDGRVHLAPARHGETYNVGRNKAKRERKSWETAPFSEFAP